MGSSWWSDPWDTNRFLKNIYLFIWPHWVLVVVHGTLVAACGIFIAACGIFSCGMRDLIPWPGMEPGPPALGAWSLNHWTTREVPQIDFNLEHKAGDMADAIFIFLGGPAATQVHIFFCHLPTGHVQESQSVWVSPWLIEAAASISHQ